MGSRTAAQEARPRCTQITTTIKTRLARQRYKESEKRARGIVKKKIRQLGGLVRWIVVAGITEVLGFGEVGAGVAHEVHDLVPEGFW